MLNASTAGFFNLAPHVMTFNAENSYGIPQINYEHRVANGLIIFSESGSPIVFHNRVLGMGATSALTKAFNQNHSKVANKEEVAINWNNS
jgi:hypothetical protein